MLALVAPAIGDGAAGGPGGPASGSDDGSFIFEPTPEAPDAQKQGAPDVDKAQKLAKSRQFADAAHALEQLDHRLPASIHDCNLALAYLRASALTRAQLAWDLSGLRNGARPKWCTGEVSTQLSEALRAASYVPTSLDIVPSDALVEIAGVKLRNMRTIWLPAGQAIVSASAPGKATKTVTVTVGPPSARVAITLEAPVVAAPTDDAGVTAPSDAPVATVVPQDAAPVAVPPTDASVVTNSGEHGAGAGVSPVWRYTALGTAITGFAAASAFGYLTYSAKQDANDHYASDPAFSSAKSNYDTYSKVTLVAGAVGIVATGVYVYLALRHAPDSTPAKPAAPPAVDVSVLPGGLGVSYSGTFGGSR